MIKKIGLTTQRYIIEEPYVYTKSKAIGLSIKNYNHAIYLNPRYDRAYYWRAKAYAKIGAIEKAKADLDKCRAINPKMGRYTQKLLRNIFQDKF